MFESFPVSRLPQPLREYIGRFGKFTTVWMVDIARYESLGGVAVEPHERQPTYGTMFDLDTGTAVWEVVRPPLNPFSMDRTQLERFGREVFKPSGPNQLLVMATPSTGGAYNITLYVAQETRVLYFDLGGVPSAQSLTEAEKYALAVMGYQAAYRKERIRDLIIKGLDMDAAFDSLVKKKFIKRTAAGALSLTPDGRMMKSQRDVDALSRRL